MEIYITSNLLLKDENLFYEVNASKTVKVNRNNWHKYLSEYDYEKLPLGWKKRLKSNVSPKNSLWGIKDCGGDGDCLFLCIVEALRDFNKMDDENYTVEKLRALAASRITDQNFILILETYKAEAETDEFDGLWDPFAVKNKKDLQIAMMEMGDSFWGDHIIIQLLSDALNLNFIILNDENELAQQEFRLQRIGLDLRKDRKTIILSYYSNVHYQLVGYFNGKNMQTVFEYDEIPPEMLDVYTQDCG